MELTIEQHQAIAGFHRAIEAMLAQQLGTDAIGTVLDGCCPVIPSRTDGTASQPHLEESRRPV